MKEPKKKTGIGVIIATVVILILVLMIIYWAALYPKGITINYDLPHDISGLAMREDYNGNLSIEINGEEIYTAHLFYNSIVRESRFSGSFSYNVTFIVFTITAILTDELGERSAQAQLSYTSGSIINIEFDETENLIIVQQ